MRYLYLLVALVSGITMALQGSLNTALGKIIGLWEATLMVHAIGTAAAAAIVFLTPVTKGDLTRLDSVPWYTLLGGILGVFIVFFVVTSIARLGVAVTTTAIIVGQVSTALLIDHFGLFGLQPVPFSWFKFAGTALLAGGAFLMLHR